MKSYQFENHYIEDLIYEISIKIDKLDYDSTVKEKIYKK